MALEKKIRETYKDHGESKMSAKYPFSRIVSLNYFSAFGLNTEIYLVNLRIQCKSGKIRTRKAPNADTFYGIQLDIVSAGYKFLVSTELKDANAFLEDNQKCTGDCTLLSMNDLK